MMCISLNRITFVRRHIVLHKYSKLENFSIKKMQLPSQKGCMELAPIFFSAPPPPGRSQIRQSCALANPGNPVPTACQCSLPSGSKHEEAVNSIVPEKPTPQSAMLLKDCKPRYLQSTLHLWQPPFRQFVNFGFIWQLSELASCEEMVWLCLGNFFHLVETTSSPQMERGLYCATVLPSVCTQRDSHHCKLVTVFTWLNYFNLSSYVFCDAIRVDFALFPPCMNVSCAFN